MTPSRPKSPQPPDDPLGPAKGIVFSVISSAVLWLLVLGWMWFA